jgi:hypothetical protein
MAGGTATELEVGHIHQCRLGDEGCYHAISGVLRHVRPSQRRREHLLGGDIQAVTGQALHQQGPGATRGVGDQPKRDLIFPKAGQCRSGTRNRSRAGIEGPVQIEQEGFELRQGIFPS